MTGSSWHISNLVLASRDQAIIRQVFNVVVECRMQKAHASLVLPLIEETAQNAERPTVLYFSIRCPTSIVKTAILQQS